MRDRNKRQTKRKKQTERKKNEVHRRDETRQKERKIRPKKKERKKDVYSCPQCDMQMIETEQNRIVQATWHVFLN